MNILLINPWIYDFSAFDLWMKPLGLLYIGSFLEHYGYTVSLVDCVDRLHPAVALQSKQKAYATGKFYAEEIPKPPQIAHIPRKYKRYGIPPKVFIEEIRKKPVPDHIIVSSMMTYWYPGVIATIQALRSVFPKTPITLGGVYATLCYDHALTHSGATYVLRGDSRQELLHLLDSTENRTRDYAALPLTTDETVYPAYHLYPELTSVSIITSLGCPYRCTYCASSLLQPQFIERSPRAVFAEIQSYQKQFSLTDIAFYDDALLIHAETRFIPLAELLIENVHGIRYHTPNGIHVRAITPRSAELFRALPVKTVRLSFESSLPHVQKASSNKTTNTELITAQTYLHNAGYSNEELEVYMLVGLPGQSYTDVIEAIHFVHDRGLIIKLAQYSPIPGTPDFLKAAEHNPLLLTEPLLHNDTLYALSTPHIGAEKLADIKITTQRLNEVLKGKREKKQS